MRSSAANISDELRVEQGILLALVLGDEAHAGHDDEDKDDGEEELDEIGVIG